MLGPTVSNEVKVLDRALRSSALHSLRVATLRVAKLDSPSVIVRDDNRVTIARFQKSALAGELKAAMSASADI